MSVSPLAAAPSETKIYTLEEIDENLAALSKYIKTTENKELYNRRINKWLDRRNRICPPEQQNL